MSETSLYEMGAQLRHALEQRDALLQLLIRLGHKEEAHEVLDYLESDLGNRTPTRRLVDNGRTR